MNQEQAYEQRIWAALAQARQHRESGDADGAAYLYCHALEWAEDVEARLGLAWTYSYNGRLEDAVLQCQKAQALDPDDGRAANDHGVYLMQQGLDDQALGYLERSIMAPRNPERHFPHYNLGRIHERRQDLGAAERAYCHALAEHQAFDAAQKALERVQRKAQQRG